ncbi:MAG: type II toxin-antitoxin system RelE/ParE family toxin [Rudanella sp.]|nr:type II toxin-antitoxin system RelE/ParE family toxin [Rudanella sp.]
MEKSTAIFILLETKEYLASLDDPIRKQFSKVFDKTQAGTKGDWFKKLRNTDGIHEFRVSFKKNIYRIFAFWDTLGETETLIVCTHGLNKKTQKTPKDDIKKAENLKRQYFS